MNEPYNEYDKYDKYDDYEKQYYSNNSNYEHSEFEISQYCLFLLLGLSCSSVFYGMCNQLYNICISYYNYKKNTNIRRLNSNDEENLLNECCICLEKYEKNEIIMELACNHNFHEKCIKEWMNKNNNCPQCREIIF